ncbi:MAG: tetratricopeptide repeat protein [Bacteroidetes bacterium]|nr:MAG: tetratricopeptide repeat protein [Bacteroidota bacterium]TAG90241.1 MAG: tetratricopeptide repeat protein [Bacteroidota bacterium]
MFKIIKLFLLLFLLVVNIVWGQEGISQQTIYAEKMLLRNQMVQLETANAMNDLYNFKFESATTQFLWFKEKYPKHPLPYFLLGLTEWWKIMPNQDITKYDKKFIAYMDSSITFAYNLYKEDKENPEASFFLSAAYGFKARLHAERGNWTRSMNNTRSALSYMRLSEKKNEEIINPELMFGDGLYNYYSAWLPDNYPLTRPIMAFFKRGDKNKGLELIKKTANNAYYTRQEALYFLVRIYRYEEEKPALALPIAASLYQDYPDNAYFQRMYASLLFSLGYFYELEAVSKSMMDKIKLEYTGYEAVSGRYAAYYLGLIYQNKGQNAEAENYYKQTLAFAEKLKVFDSYYYLSSLRELGRLAHSRKDYKTAKYYFNKLKKYGSKKNGTKEAKERLKEYKRYKDD